MVSQFNKQFLHYVRTKKLKRTIMSEHDNDDTMNQQEHISESSDLETHHL